MSSATAWVVVHVWRGLPSSVELFAREDLARQREADLRKGIRPEDEVGVFEVTLPAACGAE